MSSHARQAPHPKERRSPTEGREDTHRMGERRERAPRGTRGAEEPADESEAEQGKQQPCPCERSELGHGCCDRRDASVQPRGDGSASGASRQTPRLRWGRARATKGSGRPAATSRPSGAMLLLGERTGPRRRRDTALPRELCDRSPSKASGATAWRERSDRRGSGEGGEGAGAPPRPPKRGGGPREGTPERNEGAEGVARNANTSKSN